MKPERIRLLAAMLLSGTMLCGSLIGKAEDSDALHLQNGKVFINDQAQPGSYSAVMTHFRFLYFYVPEKGLFIISSSEFDHAVQSGRFEDREMKVDVPGIAFKLVAARSILEKNSRPAWVRYDPAFTLDVKTLMFGYGDSESAPYDWPNQVGKHI
jgi:hypothetical protein